MSYFRPTAAGSNLHTAAPSTLHGSQMVLGGGSEGGRYGSVGESGGLMGEIQYCGSGGNSRSGTSSSASSVVDDSDHCHMTHDVYQRQPLLANHDSYINANGVSKDGGGGMVKIPIPSPHRDEPRFPKEKFKTLLAFLFLFSNWIFTTASLALTHERVPNYKPLPDVTLDAVTTQEWGLDVSEIIIMITVYLCVMVLLFHKHRWILFRRVFLMMGLLYFYRSITMYVTVLPVANPHYPCAPKANYTSPVLVAKRVIQLLSGFGLSINGKHTFCGDYIYSGHTVCLVLAYLVVREYTPRRWWLLHWCFALLAVTGVVMVLIARGHYTVDCIIAYYITTRIFYIYHTLANNSSLKHERHGQCFPGEKANADAFTPQNAARAISSLHKMQQEQFQLRVVQAISLRGYGGTRSSRGLSATCRALCRAITSGRCPGPGGGAAKTLKEPPSQILSIAKLTNDAF